ncbi:MAG: hypothetical protein K0R18_31 [Bacillales bacterium]|jgi:hypothetical protein|nr:hypothetical protein [Bacillales bacterium]
METLIVVLIVVALIAVLLFGGGKLRILMKGFVGLFVEDLAKTPDGAAAVYTAAIDKAQNQYNIANDTLQRVAGQLEAAKSDLENTKKELAECENKAEAFAKAQQWDKVELFANQRNDLVEECENKASDIARLAPIFEEAKLINNNLEAKLVKLKKDKIRVVNDLKMNKQLKGMYDDMDELKNNNDIDKMVDAVKTGVRDSRETAVGARTVHDNKISTKITNANAEAKKLQGSDYANELKKKFNPGQK